MDRSISGQHSSFCMHCHQLNSSNTSRSCTDCNALLTSMNGLWKTTAPWVHAGLFSPKTDLKAYYLLVVGSWMNLLLLAVPLGWIAYFLHWGSVPIFLLVQPPCFPDCFTKQCNACMVLTVSSNVITKLEKADLHSWTHAQLGGRVGMSRDMPLHPPPPPPLPLLPLCHATTSIAGC